MKILLIGEYFSKNLGDPLLCQVVERCILESIPDAQIVPFDLSGKTSYEEFFVPPKYSSIQNWYFRLTYRFPFFMKHFSLVRVIQKDESRFMRTMCMLDTVLKQHNFDLVLFAGGSIFMDYFCANIYGIVRKFRKFKTPIVFHACGMDTLTDDTKRILQYTLKSKNIKSITLRDSYRKFVSDFSTSAHVTETYDTALACNNFFSHSRSYPKGIGIGVIGIEKYYEFQKELICAFLNSEYSWKIFCNGSPEDERMAKRILCDLGILKEKQNNYLIPTPKTPDDLTNLVTSFEYIISFRMHSQVVATSYGIPSYGFMWSDKIQDFYMKLNLANNYDIPNCVYSPEYYLNLLNVDRNNLQEIAQNAGRCSCEILLETINQCVKRNGK